jgi:spore maturation protein CgeB
LFESTGRGGFTIYPNIVGLDAFFEDKKEIVFYEHGNLGDLKTKIDYYLKNNEERENIRMAGFERTKKDHTYVNRWKTIIEELGL